MALRKVPIRLGLITVPVKIDGALEGAPSFHTVCNTGHAPVRIKQTLACPECKNADRGSFVKATETDDGKYAIVSAEKLEAATAVPDDVKNTITLTAHPAEQVQFAIPGEKTYFLAPGTDPNAYALMVRLVEERRDVALLTTFAVRSKPALYRLGVYQGALTLTEMAYPEAIRPAPENTGVVDEAMAAMASQFLDTITTDYDAASYTDTRSEAIRKVVEAADVVAAGGEAAPTAGEPTDLMAAMAAAIGQAPAKKTARKKTARKKTAAKKTARKAS